MKGIMYVVLQLNREVEIEVMGRTIEIPLSYVDGMIGALPVFATKKSAKLFAGKKYKIAEITVGKEKKQ